MNKKNIDYIIANFIKKSDIFLKNHPTPYDCDRKTGICKCGCGLSSRIPFPKVNNKSKRDR